MSVKSIGEALLRDHNDLFFELIKIPEDRTKQFQIVDENGHQIGKPRFNSPVFSWPPDLLSCLRNHLQQIWYFFESYAYWFDDTLRPLIAFDEQRINKYSIMFLLERDIDQTDGIYADYLIEKDASNYKISYFRQEQKKQTFEPAITSHEALEI